MKTSEIKIRLKLLGELKEALSEQHRILIKYKSKTSFNSLTCLVHRGTESALNNMDDTIKNMIIELEQRLKESIELENKLNNALWSKSS